MSLTEPATESPPSRRAPTGPVVTLVALLIVWQAGVMVLQVPRYLLPAPTTVLQVFITDPLLMLDHTVVTVWEVLVAYAASIAVGLPIGILAVKSRSFRSAVYPLIVGTQAVPILAAAPLLVVWFGFGIEPKIIIATLITFFPIAVGMAVGLRTVSPEAQLLARSMGLGRMRTFTKIEFPAALPSLFGGLKTATALVIVGAVVAEFVASSAGLGHVVVRASGTLDTPILFAALLVMVVMGVSFFTLVDELEVRATSWRRTG